MLFQFQAEMGKNKDISPHKIGQIEVYLSDTTFKQTEIAKKLNVSTQTISAIKKKKIRRMCWQKGLVTVVGNE